ncbi:MAG: hypothetical protein M1829_005268 [Trizodia sp. TS-e1964]|nr:MAG: hypothetical protein M1829_005268 [Trizodia sp. TS-e1964]
MIRRDNKKKGRWSSLSVFGSKSTSNLKATEDISRYPSLTKEAVDNNGRAAKQTAVSKFRRRGSKILSILLPQKGIRTRGEALPGDGIHEREVALALARDAASLENNRGALSPAEVHGLPAYLKMTTIRPPSVPLQNLDLQIISGGSSFRQPASQAGGRPSSSNSSSHNASKNRLRQSRSSLGLSRDLSHKISTALLHPTIVHRPKLRLRTSLQSLLIDPGRNPVSPQQEGNVDDTPNSYNASGSGSPRRSQSTANTSQPSESSTSPSSSEIRGPLGSTLNKAKSLPTLQGKHHDSLLTTIPEPIKMPKPCKSQSLLE